jgi:hypothetical protein
MVAKATSTTAQVNQAANTAAGAALNKITDKLSPEAIGTLLVTPGGINTLIAKSGLTGIIATTNNQDKISGNIHQAGSGRSQVMASATDAYIAGLADIAGLEVDPNSQWIARNPGHQGSLVVNYDIITPTTQTVDIPAQYQTVTTTVPTSETVTAYRPVTTVSYSTANSSSTSDSLIPFMRSVSLSYKGKGFKPTSTYNVFFDGTDVTSFIVPAQELLITSITGYSFEFDSKSDVGGSVSTSRTIVNNPVDSLKNGDIITGLTSGATGVLTGFELAPNNKLRLFLVNVIGIFSSSEIVTGSISTARGTIESIVTGSTGTVISSLYGNLFGIFNLPNTPTTKFNVGSKRLLFTTGGINDINADSVGAVNYVSNGILHTVQPVVTTIRSETTTMERYTTTVTGSSTSTSTVLVPGTGVTTTVAGEPKVQTYHGGGKYDPLAETFFVEEETGIYITAIDLYFASKDPTLPVYVSIINTVNGYPGNIEINNSRTTVNSYDVNISSNLSTLADGTTKWASPDNPTKVTFKAPIYLEGKTQYAIFIKSDSFKYRLWTSYLGDATVNGLGITAAQPVMGSLFKSQNANTWTTDQNQDLCFKLYRAKFDTSISANIPLKNTQSISKSGQFYPINVKSGSALLRVFQLGHGFQNGHSVTISDLTASTIITAGSFVVGTKYVIKVLTGTTQVQWNTAAGTSGVTYAIGSYFVAAAVGAGTGTAEVANYFGFSSSLINGSHVVSNVEPDYYTITMPYNATASGLLTNVDVKFTYNIPVDNISPRFTTLVPLNTSIKYVYAGTNTSNIKSSTNISVENYTVLDAPESLVIMSSENEINLLPSGVSSLSMGVELATSNEFVSPMFDTHRMAVVTNGYIINNPSTSMNVVGLDYNTIATSSSVITVDYTNNKFATSNSAMKLLFLTVIVGQYITVTGCSNSANNGTFLVTAVASDGASITVEQDLLTDTSTSISISVGTRFISEITPHGSSSVAKYVSKPLVFANISTAFKIFFDYNLPSGCAINFYYKISNSIDSSNHKDLNYIPITYDTSLIIDNNNNNISSGSIIEEGLSNFDTLSIKIVYTSINPHRFPRMRDFRIVALA